MNIEAAYAQVNLDSRASLHHRTPTLILVQVRGPSQGGGEGQHGTVQRQALCFILALALPCAAACIQAA